MYRISSVYRQLDEGYIENRNNRCTIYTQTLHSQIACHNLSELGVDS